MKGEAGEETKLLPELSFVTQNVWFSEYHQKKRAKALRNLLKQLKPDFICLQEVTVQFLHWLKKDSWFPSRYLFSQDEMTQRYDVLMLVEKKFQNVLEEFSLVQLTSRMGRKLLIAKLSVEGKKFWVSTSHLESESHNTETRKQQLKEVWGALEGVENCVFMGDCNFCDSSPESEHVSPEYTDLWPKLHPRESGWTEDTDVNTMRAITRRDKKQVRFDRVFLRSRTWKPKEITILGTKPIDDDSSSQLNKIFISDHFGVFASIRCEDKD